jgi:hypothetical protein
MSKAHCAALAGLIGVLTGSASNGAIKRLRHSTDARCTGECRADTIDLRWIVLAKQSRLLALG